MKTYWISFADEKNLGVVITEAEDQESAIAFLKENNLSPGGQAMFYEMPMPEAQPEVDRWGKNRIIKPEELVAAGYIKLSQLTDEQRMIVENDKGVSIVCDDHT